MKTYVQKLIGTAVLGLALCSNSLPAWAGSVDLSEVQVGTNGAQGTMAGARYSGDNQQYIGCYLSKNTSPLSLTVNCSARDKTGKSFACFSSDARLVDAVQGMTDYSHILFTSAPGTASCDYLQVTNSSAHLR